MMLIKHCGFLLITYFQPLYLIFTEFNPTAAINNPNTANPATIGNAPK